MWKLIAELALTTNVISAIGLYVVVRALQREQANALREFNQAQEAEDDLNQRGQRYVCEDADQIVVSEHNSAILRTICGCEHCVRLAGGVKPQGRSETP